MQLQTGSLVATEGESHTFEFLADRLDDVYRRRHVAGDDGTNGGR